MVEDTDAHLGELVSQLIYEIRLTVINMQIEDLARELKQAEQADDWERQRILLSHQPLLLERKQEICKMLGNRVVTI